MCVWFVVSTPPTRLLRTSSTSQPQNSTAAHSNKLCLKWDGRLDYLLSSSTLYNINFLKFKFIF